MNSQSFRSTNQQLIQVYSEFLKKDSAGGMLLLAAAVLALLVANSPLFGVYNAALNAPVVLQIGALVIDKPLFLWVNDGLMAIFFFLIGLEIKREFIEGELSSLDRVALPAIGALGGMLIPAAFYVALNWHNPAAMGGWAIPVATDIAFALALLSAFGARVPIALKVFLLTLAIFDDLAAITIIAVFYSADLSLGALGMGSAVLAACVLMNRLGVTSVAAYVLLGVVLWVAVLKSGVHATLAGVLLAFCIPLKTESDTRSPLREMEHSLHGPVSFAILPMFAFANSGLPLLDLTWADFANPVTAGIIAGLLIGKPVGVCLFVGTAVFFKWIRLPKEVTWGQILGVSFACGIGFTMSLFIASLAFEHAGGVAFAGDRLGVLVGSTLAAIVAVVVLHLSLPKKAPTNSATEVETALPVKT